jgi:pimeloyl-ACP methyl ester carboxylesterase
VALPDSGHGPHLDQAARFRDALLVHLAAASGA